MKIKYPLYFELGTILYETIWEIRIFNFLILVSKKSKLKDL